MNTKVFINLPVQDLNKSIAFFTKLGFTFSPQFTDVKATCMVISETIYVMLLVKYFFQSFTTKTVADTQKTVEVFLGLTAESRKEVDELVNKAIGAGAKISQEAQDHGFMYQRSFEDLDGHIWEIFWMDPNHISES